VKLIETNNVRFILTRENSVLNLNCVRQKAFECTLF